MHSICTQQCRNVLEKRSKKFHSWIFMAHKRWSDIQLKMRSVIRNNAIMQCFSWYWVGRKIKIRKCCQLVNSWPLQCSCLDVNFTFFLQQFNFNFDCHMLPRSFFFLSSHFNYKCLCCSSFFFAEYVRQELFTTSRGSSTLQEKFFFWKVWGLSKHFV